MQTIWKSRKFWIMLVDVIVSLTAYFVTKYTAPETSKDVLMVIGSLQPVVLMVIGSITLQNVAGIKAKAETTSAQITGVAAVTTAKVDAAK